MATTATVSASSASTTFAHVSGALSYIIDDPIKQRLSGLPIAIRFRTAHEGAEHCMSRLMVPFDMEKPDPMPRGHFNISFLLDHKSYLLHVRIDEEEKMVFLSLSHEDSKDATRILAYLKENYPEASRNASLGPINLIPLESF